MVRAFSPGVLDPRLSSLTPSGSGWPLIAGGRHMLGWTGRPAIRIADGTSALPVAATQCRRDAGGTSPPAPGTRRWAGALLGMGVASGSPGGDDRGTGADGDVRAPSEGCSFVLSLGPEGAEE